MAKANYKCTSCGKCKTIKFTPGQKVDDVICDCGKKMERQFGTVGIGYIEEDDLLAAGMMMTYHAPTAVK